MGSLTETGRGLGVWRRGLGSACRTMECLARESATGNLGWRPSVSARPSSGNPHRGGDLPCGQSRPNHCPTDCPTQPSIPRILGHPPYLAHCG